MCFLVLLLDEAQQEPEFIELVRFPRLSQFTLQATHTPQLNHPLFPSIYFDRVLVVVVHQRLAEGAAQVLVVLVGAKDQKETDLMMSSGVIGREFNRR